MIICAFQTYLTYEYFFYLTSTFINITIGFDANLNDEAEVKEGRYGHEHLVVFSKYQAQQGPIPGAESSSSSSSSSAVVSADAMDVSVSSLFYSIIMNVLLVSLYEGSV